jgi:hypothetical protein
VPPGQEQKIVGAPNGTGFGELPPGFGTNPLSRRAELVPFSIDFDRRQDHENGYECLAYDPKLGPQDSAWSMTFKKDFPTTGKPGHFVDHCPTEEVVATCDQRQTTGKMTFFYRGKDEPHLAWWATGKPMVPGQMITAVCPKEGPTAGLFKWVVPPAAVPKPPPTDPGPWVFGCDMRNMSADAAASTGGAMAGIFTPMCVMARPVPASEHLNASEAAMKDMIDLMLPKNLCTGTKGTVVASCPTQGMAGRCDGALNNGRLVTYYYQGADTALARVACGHGSWSAP